MEVAVGAFAPDDHNVKTCLTMSSNISARGYERSRMEIVHQVITEGWDPYPPEDILQTAKFPSHVATRDVLEITWIGTC